MGKVIFNKSDIIKVDKKIIQSLKDKSIEASDGKARFCLHKELGDSLHEMIIVLRKDVYVRPHKHCFKTETFHLVEGKIKIVIFNDRGKPYRKMLLNRKGKNPNLVCRLEKAIWHMVIPLTNFVVFHEITNGPYQGKEDSIFASWAPEEGNKLKIKKFISKIVGNNQT
ncbi:MAG: WbuC family cupin fold metalloprotein [Candidatus Omnitrophica bacterium]|nr:WbuC family cupin fold metalloprotein [Candidatus Omnitrophota bacterium]